MIINHTVSYHLSVSYAIFYLRMRPNHFLIFDKLKNKNPPLIQQKVNKKMKKLNLINLIH